MAKKLSQYEILLLKAKEDLIAGKYLFDGFNNHGLELNLEIIIFHFQQSAEKSIKALLDFNNIKFPKSHDIAELIKTCEENNVETTYDLQILEDLTDYAVEGRYAMIHDDLVDADKYLALLDLFIEFVDITVTNNT